MQFGIRNCKQGSYTPGKSWIFWVQFPGPGKSWKMCLVLESPGNLSARSWNFLGSDNDVGGGQNDAGADAEICVFAHLYRLFC